MKDKEVLKPKKQIPPKVLVELIQNSEEAVEKGNNSPELLNLRRGLYEALLDSLLKQKEL